LTQRDTRKAGGGKSDDDLVRERYVRSRRTRGTTGGTDGGGGGTDSEHEGQTRQLRANTGVIRCCAFVCKKEDLHLGGEKILTHLLKPRGGPGIRNDEWGKKKTIR